MMKADSNKQKLNTPLLQSWRRTEDERQQHHNHPIPGLVTEDSEATLNTSNLSSAVPTSSNTHQKYHPHTIYRRLVKWVDQSVPDHIEVTFRIMISLILTYVLALGNYPKIVPQSQTGE